MDQSSENPRAVAGGNNPPIWAILRDLPKEENFGATVSEYLRDEYKAILSAVDALLDEARAEPKVIEDAAAKTRAASLIKRMRELRTKLEAAHEREKLAFWVGGQACDQTFFGGIDKLARRSKSNNPGAADVLNQRITNYDNLVLAREQERREREAAQAAQVAREAQEKAEREAREAEEARQAAERARKPETVEAKTEIAEQKEDAASEAKVLATVATQNAEAAYVSTLAKPAEIMRKRDEAEGILTTVAQEGYAEIVNQDELDLEALRPHLKFADLEKALRAYARGTDYRKPIKGASIGRRNKSVVR